MERFLAGIFRGFLTQPARTIRAHNRFMHGRRLDRGVESRIVAAATQ